MKRQILTVFALVGIVLLAGCKKQQAITPTTGTQMTFTASTDGGEKTYLEGTTVNWSSGDKIAVYGITGDNITSRAQFDLTKGAETASGSFSGSISASTNYVAVYPYANAASCAGENAVSVSVPQTQNITSLSSFDANAALMVAKSTDDNNLTFKNVLGVFRISLTGSEIIDRIRVSSGEKYLCGTYDVNLTDMNNPTLGENPTAYGSNYIDVNLTTPTATPTINVMLPPGTYADLCVTAYSSNGKVVSTTPVESKGTILIKRSRYTERSYTVAPAVFTVKSTRKVYFSNGNLQYNGETWSFASDQWEYKTYDGTNWGLFGWSTENSNFGMSTEEAGYSGDFREWGEKAISNGGNAGGKWCTLNNYEWNYLLSQRDASTVNEIENARYMKAKIDGVCGLMIFPDVFEWPTATLPTVTDINNATNVEWARATNYSLSDWAKLEAVGVVFLPAAGSRSGSSVNDVNIRGNYWSQSPIGDNVRHLYFRSTNVNASGSSPRISGYSVRLVTE